MGICVKTFTSDRWPPTLAMSTAGSKYFLSAPHIVNQPSVLYKYDKYDVFGCIWMIFFRVSSLEWWEKKNRDDFF